MRILLINPPNCGRSIPEERHNIGILKQILRGEPLSLEVLAGNLTGHDVKILDLKAAPDALDRTLSDFEPHIVGITASTCEAKTALKIAAQSKKSGGPTVVVGGIHASSDPAFFNVPQIDYIVVGLGKLSFRELVEAVELKKDPASIPGVIRTLPGKPLVWTRRQYSADDLVEDRSPRYDLVTEYRDSYILKTLGFHIGYVATSFGCPFRCAFCVMDAITGGQYFVHGTDTVLRDIALLGDIPIIRLADANTFGNVVHSEELCMKIEETGMKKHFVVDARSDTVVKYPRLFKMWKNAGLRSVVIGFEEIDDGKLAGMDKRNTVATNEKAIDILHELGITIVGDFIVSPDYGDDDFEALSRFVKKNRIDLPMFTIMTPLPGSRMYESMKDRIVIDDLDYYTLTNAVVPTKLEEGAFYEHYAHLINDHMTQAKL